MGPSVEWHTTGSWWSRVCGAVQRAQCPLQGRARLSRPGQGVTMPDTTLTGSQRSILGRDCIVEARSLHRRRWEGCEEVDAAFADRRVSGTHAGAWCA